MSAPGQTRRATCGDTRRYSLHWVVVVTGHLPKPAGPRYSRSCVTVFLSNLKESNAMSRGFPSMTALLGLLAIAGYQHRDKIAEMLRGLGQSAPGAAGQSGLGGLLGELRNSLGGTSAGGMLSGGLGELVDRFKQSGQSETVDSWVKTGPNKPITPTQLEQAIGPDILDTLTKQTGLSREELLARLARELPDAVDKYTPQGRLPAETGS
jgi:uncharacterized protein YidB (DUF937 family)